jgi:rhamnosyltransferase
MRLAAVIPTLNGGETFSRVLAGLRSQSLAPRTLLVIDSGSVDGTVPLALAGGARVHRIKAPEFNHGATRELGRQLVEADYYLFMTQDALPAHARVLENLVRPLTQRQEIGLAYGRQLPWPQAHPLEALNRHFNYPAASRLKTKADRGRLGLKTVFCSNACALYRASALEEVGGFPPVIMCEDQYVAARMLEAGYAVYYAAEAQVFHSHNYSMWEECRRYFDAGVFFGSRERWIVEGFGAAGPEGLRLVREGRRYLSRAGKTYLFPYLLLRLFLKFAGYQLGARERFLPNSLKARLSLHGHFWRDLREPTEALSRS